MDPVWLLDTLHLFFKRFMGGNIPNTYDIPAWLTGILLPQVHGEKMEVDRREVPLYVSASVFFLRDIRWNI